MFHETYVNNKWKKYKSEKKIEMNYAEKQNNANYHYKKQDNTYFFEGDDFYQAPVEIPLRFHALYKSYNPNTRTSFKGGNFVLHKQGSLGSKK